MKDDVNEVTTVAEAEGRSYSAPALEKGLDILEVLCRSDQPLSQKDIAQRVGRTTGEIYRMVACLVNRNYVTLVDENTYAITTKLFELAHINSPTQRLLQEAAPLMQRLASELDQSCHLTVYGQGKQVVLFKVDTPSGMGFAIRAGAEIDVLISASGRVLVAFQDDETRALRVEESLARRPDQADPQIDSILDSVRSTGYESIPSVQVRGLYAVSFPILDTQGHAIAALTVPYAERLDQVERKSIPEVTLALGEAARTLSARIGGMVGLNRANVPEKLSAPKRSSRSGGR
ncbi:IclR family transcriptional regulator [Variovorax robiniae]|uniref:IclR family transcriptional regulator n=1 Tax=Variovorax robiniae TaxID=1836199 RepID=A0ABU8XJR0_9BURK